MNFLKDKVRKYQEKKLVEAKENLESHIKIKRQLESQLKALDDKHTQELEQKIENQEKLVAIWKKNVISIEKQLKKLNS